MQGQPLPSAQHRRLSIPAGVTQPAHQRAKTTADIRGGMEVTPERVPVGTASPTGHLQALGPRAELGRRGCFPIKRVVKPTREVRIEEAPHRHEEKLQRGDGEPAGLPGSSCRSLETLRHSRELRDGEPAGERGEQQCGSEGRTGRGATERDGTARHADVGSSKAPCGERSERAAGPSGAHKADTRLPQPGGDLRLLPPPAPQPPPRGPGPCMPRAGVCPPPRTVYKRIAAAQPPAAARPARDPAWRRTPPRRTRSPGT